MGVSFVYLIANDDLDMLGNDYISGKDPAMFQGTKMKYLPMIKSHC